MPNSAWSPAYLLQTAALENQQNSPDLRVLDCCSTHSEPWSALAIKFSKPDRVGRRGLSEPGGIFSRLLTYAWTQKWFVQILATD